MGDEVEVVAVDMPMLGAAADAWRDAGTKENADVAVANRAAARATEVTLVEGIVLKKKKECGRVLGRRRRQSLDHHGNAPVADATQTSRRERQLSEESPLLSIRNVDVQL